jgi:hypothetical protein
VIRRYPRLRLFAYEYFIFLGRVASPSAITHSWRTGLSSLGRLHTHGLFAGFESGSGRGDFHTYRLTLPVASTDHARGQSDVERRTGQTCQTCKFQCSYMETDKLPTARSPTCRVQVRHASLADWQLGEACADRLRVITPIHLHCIQRWSP